MKNKTRIYQQWLDAAYIEFAHSGPDFSLKALAEKAKLPRATLYYHFDDKEHLVLELLNYHRDKVEIYLAEMRHSVKTLIPDLYQLLLKYKEELLFHHKLLKYCDVDQYCSLYRSTNERSLNILLPLIKAQFETDKSDQEIISFYHNLTDVWYTRLNTNNLCVDTMIDLAVEILESTLGLYQNVK